MSLATDLDDLSDSITIKKKYDGLWYLVERHSGVDQHLCDVVHHELEVFINDFELGLSFDVFVAWQYRADCKCP